MSHRLPPAPKLRPAPEPCRSEVEPCHPEVPRGVRPASGVEDPPARGALSAFPIPHSPFPPRSGLTLIEMLVALAVTLVMMAAVVNLFANISGSIRNRRAVIEVSSQLRQVRQRLASDLEGATSQAIPWQRTDRAAGYIEIIEGEWFDSNPSQLLDDEDPADGDLDYTTSIVPSAGDPQILIPQYAGTGYNASPVSRVGAVTNGGALGDWDDVLALTVRSEAEPFRAQVGNAVVESTDAEVVWYAEEIRRPSVTDPPEPEDGMRRIYRRVYLIADSLGPWAIDNRPENVSVHYAPADPVTGALERWVANTLGDLTKRENRAGRNFPPAVIPPLNPLIRNNLSNSAEYLVLTDALAFDVRVFDPGAPIYEATGGTVVQPGDPGWASSMLTAGAIPVGYGAYVDLRWNGFPILGPGVPSPYSPISAIVPQLQFGLGDRVKMADAGGSFYDTWSFHYENDGINQDNNVDDTFGVNNLGVLPAIRNWRNALDQGVNGLDDDGINGVDDPRERETGPMYNVPLRGVKVSLRVYERDARQIREVSVTHSFAE